jgi:hypothetical protein
MSRARWRGCSTHRIELIDPAIAKNGGRIIKTTGDGMLVEFPSVVDAVGAPSRSSSACARRNADVPEERQIQFRFGINLGDVIFDDGDVFGDGVNIAARVWSSSPSQRRHLRHPRGLRAGRTASVDDRLRDHGRAEAEEHRPADAASTAPSVDQDARAGEAANGS